MGTMISLEVGMRLWMKKKRKENKSPINEKKERRGDVTILLPHLCFGVAPYSSYRDSSELSLSYTS